ncbi:MAG TPA: sulfite exporter TauE/SafE family protein [Tepidisphaeraceae bacterium]|jgi:hypothetical protein
MTYYTLAALAILILGISKTGFGGGGIGILSMPLLIMAMPAARAVAILGILLVLVDLVANLHYLGEYEWPVLKWLLPGAVIGVAIGIWIYFTLQRGGDPRLFDRKLNFIIGMICLAVVAMQVWRMLGFNIATLPTGPKSSICIGCVAGAASAIAHAAGPIVSLYVLQERLEKRRLVGTLLMYTLLINSVKLVMYIAVSLVTLATLRDSLWMIPILPLGTVLGAWMNRKLPEKPFLVIMYTAAAVASVQMIYKALA